MCSTCPVRSECLEYAIAAEERWGVWGGLTAPERERLMRRQG
jgi:WhiB family redox-sensing transcriptional regulator